MKKAVLFALLAGAAIYLVSQPALRPTLGKQADGRVLLPNGWQLDPAGRQIPLDTMPSTSLVTPDGKHLLVLHQGYNPPSVAVLSLPGLEEKSRVKVPDAWLGMTMTQSGDKVYVGGGSQSAIYEFSLSAAGALTNTRTFEITPAATRTHEDFVGDVKLSPNDRLLYATLLYRDQVLVINPQSGRVIERVKTGRRPYQILFHPLGASFFVSSWANAAVYQHKAETAESMGMTRVGAHPTGMLWSDRQPKLSDEEKAEGVKIDWKYRLFVTAANTNRVDVLGVSDRGEVRNLENINVAMFPRQPAGMTPTALALSADQSSLYVVCSDANAVAVVDVTGRRSQVQGFVPTGWYPVAARSLADGRLLVMNGRGERSFPNPNGPNPTKKAAPVHLGNAAVEYVGRIQTGTISVIDPFNDQTLAAYTKRVFANTPYRDELLDEVNIPPGNPIPSKVEPGKSPIEHVIYIVKENRTYDQVLGNLGIGNGDPNLALFDESNTPNHRKLAKEFVLLDNFYVNADVSADGHNWSTSAIANDYVQKMWPNSYGGRRKHYDYEGGEPAAIPPAGYIWSNAQAAGVSLRNYGWWTVNGPAGSGVKEVRDPTLRPVTNLAYRGFDLEYLDVDRAKVFIEDLGKFEQSGVMPKLIFLRLGNDHTSGLAAGKYSPRAAMADNDWALGQVVEAVSKSRFWAKTAIFVLEDDAQNGPDHVDSHRSPAYVLSPYTRRGIIDSTLYNTTSVLRTMELILGIKPMTQFDAAARPMWNAFSPKPDPKPYAAVKPTYPMDERNVATPATAALVKRSNALDFDEADEIDDDVMNQILWRGLKGTDPPVPVRSFFGR
ncbi:MAG: bifunctional YncE family protein/alkaline phosphatase family protein [Bryobacteraceae bacterium]|nr:bifunctional YncE family protein/alkaline phosphatase family protein [Bryobacteraceae bacterium]